MAAGDIKMLATVSPDTNVLLYRELEKLPERKRVKRLLALAQIGQLAEMAAQGVQLLPTAPVPSLPTQAVPGHIIAAPTAVVSAPAGQSPRSPEDHTAHAQAPAPAPAPAPTASLPPSPAPAAEEPVVLVIPLAAPPASALPAPPASENEDTSPSSGVVGTSKRRRLKGHGFKVTM